MGKAQSKRSVDITTEAAKDGKVEEGSGKMGKIEDVDQLKPQLNGTQHNENEISDKEKKVDAEGGENEKDVTTEKEAAAKTNGHAEEAETKPESEENGVADETLNESKVSEAASPTSPVTEDEKSSDKKPKKDKVKKKWSFRSISFSKKDKQKPAKKEEQTNGEIEKVPEEPQQEAAAVAAATTEDKPTETTTAAVETKSEEIATPAAEVAAPAVVATEEVKPTEVAAPAEPKPIENGTSAAEEPKPEPVATPVAPVAEPEITTEPATEEVVPEPIKEAEPELKPVEEEKHVEVSSAPEPAKVEETSAAEPAAVVEVKEEVINADEIKTVETTESVKDLVEESASSPPVETPTESIPPPPLPSNPPPSQVTVFAESAMSQSSAEEANVETSVPLPAVVAAPINLSESVDQVNEASEKSDVPAPPLDLLSEGSVAEVECDKVLEHVPESVPEPIESIENVAVLEAAKPVESEALELPVPPADPQLDEQKEDTSSDEPKAQEIAETIALIEKVTDGEMLSSSNDDVHDLADEVSLPPPPPLQNEQGISDDEPKDISVDLSSPLPQNSLESLPSPTLSQSDSSLPPPPPPTESTSEIAAAQNEQTTTTDATKLTVETTSETEETVLPAPAPEPINLDDEIKVNGNQHHHHEEPKKHLNGHAKQSEIENGRGDEGQQHNNLTDKNGTGENGVNETSTTESHNGDLENKKESIPEKCSVPPPTNPTPEQQTAE